MPAAPQDHAVAGRYDEAQVAYDHAITQIQGLIAANTGRPWDAVQVELANESLLVRETALELRRIQLQVPELLAAARKDGADAPPDVMLSCQQHIDHGASERRRRPTTSQQTAQPERASRRDTDAARSHASDSRVAAVSDARGSGHRVAADAVNDPSVWSPPPKIERLGTNRSRQHDPGVPSWARQLPAQQPRRGTSTQRGAGQRGTRSDAGRGDRSGDLVGNHHAGAPADTDRRRRRPSSANGDRAWRNGMKPRDSRDSRGAGSGARSGGGGSGRKDASAAGRRQQQYTPLAGDAELAEIIERDVLNRNPVRFKTFSISCGSLEVLQVC